MGAWLRQLLRAGTAAAIVPVAMVAALVVVLVGAGGFGGLSSLRQLVIGPAIPPAVAAAVPRPDDVGQIAPPAPRPERPRVTPASPPPPPPAATEAAPPAAPPPP